MQIKSHLQSEWKIKLEQWRASGLSGSAWCRNHGISYYVFQYWRKKLETKKSEHKQSFSPPAQFIELIEQPSKNFTGIEIECQGAILRLSKEFDGTTFQRCIQLLRSL